MMDKIIIAGECYNFYRTLLASRILSSSGDNLVNIVKITS